MRDEAAQIVLEMCIADCPVSEPTPTNFQSGLLRDSLRIEDTEDDDLSVSVSIGSDLDYAQYTDEVDTSIHPIDATNVPFMRFWWENAPIEWGGPGIYKFEHVTHPGTKGQKWFSSKMEDRWQTALEQVQGGP